MFHVKIKISDDYVSWLESLDAEFSGRLIKILRGPMWSGQDQSNYGKPLKVKWLIHFVSWLSILFILFHLILALAKKTMH
jgi:hypothetical protein